MRISDWSSDVCSSDLADRYDPAMARLIDNLELLGRGALPQLKRICGVDDEDMADMIRELRAYDPKPGLKYGSDISQAIVPDLFVMERARSEEHTSELQSLMRISYAVFCLKKKKTKQ